MANKGHRYKCGSCDKGFTSPRGISQHYRTHPDHQTIASRRKQASNRLYMQKRKERENGAGLKQVPKARKVVTRRRVVEAAPVMNEWNYCPNCGEQVRNPEGNV